MEIEVERVAAEVSAVGKHGLAGHDLAGQTPVLIEHEAGVDGLDAVVAAGEFAIGEEHADVGLLAELTLDPRDADFCTFVEVRIVRIERLAGGPIVNGKQAKIPAAELAGQARAEFGVDDAA